VIGVFAHLETHEGTTIQGGFRSSLRLRPIIQLEDQLATLKSPRWPEDILGPIDAAKASRGEALFNSKCVGCHSPLKWDNLTTQIETRMVPIQSVKTDVFLACNTFLHRAKAGHFEGQFSLTGEIIGAEDVTRHMLGVAASAAVLRKVQKLETELFRDAVRSGRDSRTVSIAAGYRLEGSADQKEAQAEQCRNTENDILAYKARPLNGIWATAPYLHNGSVPTLYDLLLPETAQNGATDRGGAATRPEIFGVGSHEFDPKKVGFITDLTRNPTTFRVRDEKTGEPIPGNSNAGHSYGTDLTDDERYELVEYLKSL
jgi:hypothetical protein